VTVHCRDVCRTSREITVKGRDLNVIPTYVHNDQKILNVLPSQFLYSKIVYFVDNDDTI
jgi:hypothetical protein